MTHESAQGLLFSLTDQRLNLLTFAQRFSTGAHFHCQSNNNRILGPKNKPKTLHSSPPLLNLNFYRQDITHFGHITDDLQVKLLNWTYTTR